MQLVEIIDFLKNNPVISIAWVITLIAFIVLTLRIFFSKVKTIRPAEVVNLMNNQNAVIVDVRTHDAFHTAHIVNAINMTPTALTTNNVGTLDKYKELPIIIVDVNGLTARQPAEALLKAGFSRVYVLKGGIATWSEENMPLVRGKK